MSMAGESAVGVVSRQPQKKGDSFDPLRARQDFPILWEERDGQRLVFLDSAASAQKPQCVIDSISDCYSHAYANIHRGVYELSARATADFEGARETVRRFLGAAEAREIIFVRSALRPPEHSCWR